MKKKCLNANNFPMIKLSHDWEIGVNACKVYQNLCINVYTHIIQHNFRNKPYLSLAIFFVCLYYKYILRKNNFYVVNILCTFRKSTLQRYDSFISRKSSVWICKCEDLQHKLFPVDIAGIFNSIYIIAYYCKVHFRPLTIRKQSICSILSWRVAVLEDVRCTIRSKRFLI